MIIGIDLGTSTTKAAAFAHDGEALAVAVRKTTMFQFGNDSIEQDFEQVLATVGEVVQEVCAKVNDRPIAIGITGQGDGLWLLDKHGRSVRPAISWLDGRGNAPLQNWMDSGVYEAVFRRNANAIFPGCHAPFLAAVSQTEPEVLERAATASYLKDGILQRLTGARVTDASDASLPFLDIRTRQYDPEILRLLGLSRFERLLAPVMTGCGQAYPLNAAGSAITGLPVGIPIHAGPFDLPACAIGAGVNKVGDGLIIMGTTLACETLVDKVDTTGDPVGMTICMPSPGTWLRAMPAMVGTASLDWVLNLVGSKPEDVEGIIAQSAPGARGVTALPYFAATGERAPFADVRARGQFAGLTMNSTRADLVTAICESVAYAARHCIEATGLDGRLFVCGGGSNSPLWRQMIADVLQVPLHVARRPEVGARGAAIAAMDVLQIDYDFAEWTTPETIVEPNVKAKNYQIGFTQYLETVASARKLWK